MGKYFQIAVLPRGVAIAIAAMFSMMLAACGSDSGQQASEAGSTQAPESTTTEAAPSTTTPDTQQAFNNPVVAGKQPTGMPLPVAAAPNLIQPTNPTERAVVVDKGRTDPFAQIVTPQFVPQPGSNQPGVGVVNNGNTNMRRSVPNVPVLPNTATNKITGASGNKSSSQVAQSKLRQRSRVASARLPNLPVIQPVIPRVMPPVVTDPSLSAVLPPTPQPEMARAVMVSGVVMVGDQAQAIIKVPNEPTSRYVQAGDRLANGVLIKRIEMNGGSDPVVIFEQFGIEVAKMVGEGGATTTAAMDNNTIPTPPSVPTGAS